MKKITKPVFVIIIHSFIARWDHSRVAISSPIIQMSCFKSKINMLQLRSRYSATRHHVWPSFVSNIIKSIMIHSSSKTVISRGELSLLLMYPSLTRHADGSTVRCHARTPPRCWLPPPRAPSSSARAPTLPATSPSRSAPQTPSSTSRSTLNIPFGLLSQGAQIIAHEYGDFFIADNRFSTLHALVEYYYNTFLCDNMCLQHPVKPSSPVTVCGLVPSLDSF